MKTLSELLDQYQDFFDVVRSSHDYTEPGYSLEGKEIILLGNLDKDYKELYSFSDEDWEQLEELAEFEWEDEWTTCNECQRAVRTEPNSWGWKRSFWEHPDDGSIICEECLTGDDSLVEEYLEYLEGNAKHALTFWLDLSEHGYVCVLDRLEHGLHYGQNADPKVIAKSLKKMGVRRFVFSLDMSGQFDLSFSLWVHEEEIDQIVNPIETDLPFDIATEFAKVLRGEHSDYIRSDVYIVKQSDLEDHLKTKWGKE